MTSTTAALREDDLADLLALYEHLHQQDESLDEDTARERWTSILAMPGHDVLAIRQGRVLVASCVLQVVPNLTRGGRPYGLIENVVVHADHRRRGMGTALLQDALDRAWASGCYKVMLLSGNVAAGHFYEAAGFDGVTKRGFLARAPG